MLHQTDKLSIVNKTGQIEPSKASSEDGLVDIFHFKNRGGSSSLTQSIKFDLKGQSFSTIDKGGNVTLFHRMKNRYVNLTTNTPAKLQTFIDNDQGHIAFGLGNYNLVIHNQLNGKLIKNLKWHQFHLINLQVNHIKQLLLSVSHDCCTLWNISNYQRHKNLFSKSSQFAYGLFSSSGTHLITLYWDGTIQLWNLGSLEIEGKWDLRLNLQNFFGACSLDSRYLVVAGPNQNLFVVDLQNQEGVFQTIVLPKTCNSVQKAKFTSQNHLYIVGDNDKIYCLDTRAGFKVILQHNLPRNEAALDLDVDVPGQNLLILSNTGDIYLYDAHKLLKIESEQMYRRLGAGIDPNLATTTLKTLGMSETIRNNLERFNDMQGRIDENTNPNLNETEDALNFMNQSSDLLKSTTQNNRGGTNLKNSSFKNPNTSQTSSFQTMQRMFKSSQIEPEGLQNMNPQKLHKFLARFKVYPDKHRALIWQFLLKLPLNYEAFDNLIHQGLHSCTVNLYKKFSLNDQVLYSKLQRLLSCLAHYCPAFGEVDFLPGLVFPFVKLFAVDEVLCFEIVLSFLMNWGQHFFEFFPNPPINLLQAIDDLLRQHDSELHQHFKQHDFSITTYMWPLVQVWFTDVFSRDDWLALMDFMVTNTERPELLLMIIVSYLTYFRKTLLKINSLEELDIFLRRQSALNIQQIIQGAKDLLSITPEDQIHINFVKTLPLSNEQYQIFNFYPKFSVDHHKKMREKILEEQSKADERKRAIQELHNLTENLVDLESRFKDRQEALIRAERDRKEMMLYEEEMRLGKKQQLDNQFRDRRLSQIKMLQSTVRSNLENQQKMRDEDILLLEHEMMHQRKMDNMFITSKMEEEALLNLQFQANQRMNELIELRNREERERKMRLDLDQRNKEEQICDQAIQERWKFEEEEIRLQRDLLRQQQLMSLNLEVEENQKKKIQNEMMVKQFEQELKFADIERERNLRRIAEQEADKAEELAKIIREQEVFLQKEEELQFRKFMNEEKKQTLQRGKERLMILQREQLEQIDQLQQHREKLKQLAMNQNKSEVQQRIIEIRRQAEEGILNEEKQLQDILLNIEEEKRVQKELQNDLLLKQQEYQERQAFYMVAQENESRIVEDERRKFLEFKKSLEQQQEQIQDIKEQLHRAQMRDQMHLRERDLRSQSQEIRERIQKENMQKIEREIIERERNDQQHNPVSRVKFSSHPNTHSLYSYSYSETNQDSGKSHKYRPHNDEKESQDVQNSSLRKYEYDRLGYDMQYNQYGSGNKATPISIRPQVQSLSSSQYRKSDDFQHENNNSQPGKYYPGYYSKEHDTGSADRYGNSHLSYSSGNSHSPDRQFYNYSENEN